LGYCADKSASDTGTPAHQHRSPAAQGNPGITRPVQPYRKPHVLKTHIGRRQQIATRIGKRAIKIKDNRPHPPRSTASKSSAQDIASQSGLTYTAI
jgi:hypothetical protein